MRPHALCTLTKMWVMLLMSIILSTCSFGNPGGCGFAEATPSAEILVISALVDNLNFSVLELTACTTIANLNAYKFVQSHSSSSISTTYDGDYLSNIAPGTKIYVTNLFDFVYFQDYYGPNFLGLTAVAPMVVSNSKLTRFTSTRGNQTYKGWQVHQGVWEQFHSGSCCIDPIQRDWQAVPTLLEFSQSVGYQLDFNKNDILCK